MTNRLSIRLTSFALSVVVTVSLVVGLQTLAQEQHAGGQQISQSNAAQPA